MTERAPDVARKSAPEAALTREFDVPRERVWRAFTDPEQLARWWGPRGMTTEVRALDLRAGGAYEFAMVAPDGTLYPLAGTYLEVARPVRLVCTENVDRHPREWHEQIRAQGADPRGKVFGLTVALDEPATGRTRLTVTTQFETPELRDAFLKLGLLAGWNGQLDKLEDLVADASGRELATSRRLDAPPERVYRAWAEPARLQRWWGPRGFTNEFEVCETKPDGRWKFVMVAPDGARFSNESVFVELVPGRKVVIDHLSPPRFRLVATFDAEGNGTRVTWRQIFPSRELCEKVRPLAAPANEENLDRLAAEVAAMQEEP